MFGVHSGAVFHSPVPSYGAASVPGPRTGVRALALLVSGRRQGPITRLIAPGSIGELTTPFLSLDYAEVPPGAEPLVGTQPQSGIATLAVVLDGQVSFVDASGVHREVNAGGFVWMPAPHADWRGGGAAERPLRVFQLWISLSEAQRTPPAVSEAIAPYSVEEEGPARVILGQFGRARSAARSAPADINFLHLRLKDRERWRYAAPAGHNVTWLAVDRGGLELQQGGRVYWEQLGVFGDSTGPIEVQADGDTSFLLGSARRR
jgi:redox-sensitive bicupin YhaK (pirin superfamily)